MTRATAVLFVALVAVPAIESGSVIARQPSLQAPVAIPFELATRHIIVKGRVNDSPPLSFALDTGANRAIVRLDTAKKLGLPLYGNVQSGGAGAATQQGQLIRNAAWSLLGLGGFSQPMTLALPMAFLPSALGRDVDGIIGGEFIGQFVLELDYQARTMVLHDRRTFRYTGKGETLPLELDPNGHPFVKAVVTPLGGKPIEHRFMLDIGSGLALALHSPFVAEHDLLGGEIRTIRAIGLTGAGGTSVGRLGRVAALQIGSFKIESPITLFSQDKAGAFANASLAGNIGAQIASRFRMILDYSRRSIILEPSQTFAEPFDRAISGLVVRAEGSDYRIFRVREVLENSPATEAGLAVGDIITSVGGAAAESFTLTSLLELLQTPVTRELTIRRGDKILKVALTPKRLI